MKRIPKEDAKELAEERIERLLETAETAAADQDLELANTCIEKAWAIKLKFRIRMRPDQKKLFCKKCLRFLADGKTGRFRTRDKKLTITCLNCGYVSRVPMGQKKQG
ncbi:MAG: ribonuclease P [Candidatus Altiarchaeota archaeon]|nr:ribonuclease P [Candidatus Altiarchaeota archaeon]